MWLKWKKKGNDKIFEKIKWEKDKRKIEDVMAGGFIKVWGDYHPQQQEQILVLLAITHRG